MVKHISAFIKKQSAESLRTVRGQSGVPRFPEPGRSAKSVTHSNYSSKSENHSTALGNETGEGVILNWIEKSLVVVNHLQTC